MQRFQRRSTKFGCRHRRRKNSARMITLLLLGQNFQKKWNWHGVFEKYTQERIADISNSIIALRLQPIRGHRRRWLFLNNHLLKMNNHLPLQFTSPSAILYLGWLALLYMTCICFDCSALPPRFSEFIYRSIATS